MPTSTEAIDSGDIEALGELVSDKLLESLGYVINTRGRFLICMGCRKPTLPSLASGHAHEQHGLPKFEHDLLQPYIHDYELFESADDFEKTFLLPSPSPDHPPISHIAFDGVDVKSAYRCSKCAHVRGTVKSIESHWREDHKGTPFQKPISEPGQCIYLSSQFRRWLLVQPRLSSPTMDDTMQACLDAYYRLPDKLGPADTNAREPPPWLRKLGWLKWMSGYDSAVLDDFVQSVRAHSLFRNLSDVLVSYLEKAMNALDEMPAQIRQILRSVTE